MKMCSLCVHHSAPYSGEEFSAMVALQFRLQETFGKGKVYESVNMKYERESSIRERESIEMEYIVST